MPVRRHRSRNSGRRHRTNRSSPRIGRTKLRSSLSLCYHDPNRAELQNIHSGFLSLSLVTMREDKGRLTIRIDQRNQEGLGWEEPDIHVQSADTWAVSNTNENYPLGLQLKSNCEFLFGNYLSFDMDKKAISVPALWYFALGPPDASPPIVRHSASTSKTDTHDPNPDGVPTNRKIGPFEEESHSLIRPRPERRDFTPSPTRRDLKPAAHGMEEDPGRPRFCERPILDVLDGRRNCDETNECVTDISVNPLYTCEREDIARWEALSNWGGWQGNVAKLAFGEMGTSLLFNTDPKTCAYISSSTLFDFALLMNAGAHPLHYAEEAARAEDELSRTRSVEHITRELVSVSSGEGVQFSMMPTFFLHGLEQDVEHAKFIVYLKKPTYHSDAHPASRDFNDRPQYSFNNYIIQTGRQSHLVWDSRMLTTYFNSVLSHLMVNGTLALYADLPDVSVAFFGDMEPKRSPLRFDRNIQNLMLQRHTDTTGTEKDNVVQLSLLIDGRNVDRDMRIHLTEFYPVKGLVDSYFPPIRPEAKPDCTLDGCVTATEAATACALAGLSRTELFRHDSVQGVGIGPGIYISGGQDSDHASPATGSRLLTNAFAVSIAWDGVIKNMIQRCEVALGISSVAALWNNLGLLGGGMVEEIYYTPRECFDKGTGRTVLDWDALQNSGDFIGWRYKRQLINEIITTIRETIKKMERPKGQNSLTSQEAEAYLSQFTMFHDVSYVARLGLRAKSPLQYLWCMDSAFALFDDDREEGETNWPTPGDTSFVRVVVFNELISGVIRALRAATGPLPDPVYVPPSDPPVAMESQGALGYVPSSDPMVDIPSDSLGAYGIRGLP